MNGCCRCSGKPLPAGENIEVVQGDILKLPLDRLLEENSPDRRHSHAGGSVRESAVLYHSPIIMLLLESRLPFTSLTVMVQGGG